MRILILGGDGMLGHRLLLHLKTRHDVKVSLRQNLDVYRSYGLFDPSNAYGSVDVRSIEKVVDLVEEFRPQAIVNAVGVVKQRSIAKESIPSIEINSLLPHRLARVADDAGARLIHISTDCVFSGKRGHYSEDDPTDPQDLYGYTKLLGEVADHHCMTLRTSLIGHELARKQSLVEWFLAQTTQVRGFTKAIFSGLSTIEMARVIETLLVEHPAAHGIWHLSSEPIDKFTLLNLVKKHYGVNTQIVADGEFRCDRSLDSTRFRQHFHYQPPSWDDMISEMSAQRSLQS